MKTFNLFVVILGLTLSSFLVSSASGTRKTKAATQSKAAKKLVVKQSDVAPDEPDHTADDYYLQGVMDKVRGRPKKAVEDYRKAISLAPNCSLFHVALADLLFEQNRLSEAAEEMRQIVRLQPTSAYWHLRLGNTLNLAGQRVEARKEWQKVIILDGDGDYSDEARKMLKLFL